MQAEDGNSHGVTGSWRIIPLSEYIAEGNVMPLKDWLAALVIVCAWGINFVVIKLALGEIPPLLLGALRFTFVAFPAILFVKRPQLPWRIIVLYGLTISLGPFVFLFTAMYVGMPAGLASLVLPRSEGRRVGKEWVSWSEI